MDPNKAVDPVCGMEVDRNTEFHAMHGGKEYYFCSREDREEFQKHPAKYAGKREKEPAGGKQAGW